MLRKARQKRLGHVQLRRVMMHAMPREAERGDKKGESWTLLLSGLIRDGRRDLAVHASRQVQLILLLTDCSLVDSKS